MSVRTTSLSLPQVVRAIEKLTEYAEVNPDRFPKISRKIFRCDEVRC